MKRRTIKKYRPKRRLKINLAIKNNTILLSYIILAAFIVIFIKINYSKIIRIGDISFTKSTIRKVIVNSYDPKIKEQIENILSGWLSKPYSNTITKEIKNTLNATYPYLKISEKFNPITGSFIIDISKLSAIAKSQDKELYILEDLTLSNKDPDPGKEYPLIRIIDNNPDQNLLKFFLRVYKTELFKIINSTIIVYMEATNPIVQYGDNVKLVLPMDFQSTDLEIGRIKKVINDAKNRIGDRFNIDARYISEGKIIIKSLK